MRQADVFLNSEADCWLERNRDKLGERDPVMDVMQGLNFRPRRALEVGCADGWRLEKLRNTYGCEVFGAEPGRQAGIEAAARRVPVVQCTAATLAVPGPFDLVIYGFCLYLADPSEWLRVAADGDSVLVAGGHLVIHDFAAIARPFARPYEHRDGILSYHFDFAGLWLASPLYHVIGRYIIGDDEMVTVLKKSDIATIPVRP